MRENSMVFSLCSLFVLSLLSLCIAPENPVHYGCSLFVLSLFSFRVKRGAREYSRHVDREVGAGCLNSNPLIC